MNPCPIDPPTCRPFYVATGVFIAECPAGMIGGPVKITRQFKSFLSTEHAQVQADRLAKCEALAELRCLFRSTKCMTPSLPSFAYPICRTADSTTSQIDADNKAFYLAQAAVQAFPGS